MYIIHNETKYVCKCNVSLDTVTYTGLPDNFPLPVSGEIGLHADDGFILRTDVVEDYLRQTFEDGTLILTNVPESTDDPDEPIEYEPTADEILNALLGVV